VEFEVLYSRIIELWPESVGISDGKPNGENGIVFPTLSKCWDVADGNVDSAADTWGDLGVWAFFQAFHESAEECLRRNESVLSTRLVSKRLIDRKIRKTLATEGWERELGEYKGL
jgi:hypothetical protein